MTSVCWIVYACLLLFCIRHTCSTLVIDRPQNGTGPITISYEDILDAQYNPNRLLFVFNKSCVQNYEMDESQDTDTMNQYIEQIRSTYINCVALTNNTLNVTHYDTQLYSYVFFDLFCSVFSMQQLSNVSINYDALCIEYITYEPTFSTLVETVPAETPSFACMRLKTAYYKSYGIDLLDSMRLDDRYSYPQFINNSINNERQIDLHILDSGIQSTHVEFETNQVIHIMGDGPATYDGQYGDHGTHVAGIASGINYGSSKNATIYDYRVCEYNSDGSEMPCYGNLIFSALFQAYTHIKETGKSAVINLSLGGTKSDIFDDPYDFYFAELISVGAVPVVAAGNEDTDACKTSPAYSTNAITVGSYDRNRRKSSFSNWGQCVDVWAPGTSIYSAIASASDNKYEYKQGTSMASPYVAGLVVNLLYINPQLSFEDIKAILLTDTDYVTGGECDIYDCERGHYKCESSIVYDVPQGLQTWHIVLIVLGSVFLVCVVGMIVLWCIKKNKQKNKEEESDRSFRQQYNEDEFADNNRNRNSNDPEGQYYNGHNEGNKQQQYIVREYN